MEAEEQAAASTSTVKMEPVFNLAMEHVKKDILAACKIMGISPSEYLKETLEHKGMRFLTVLIGKNCATFLAILSHCFYAGAITGLET